MPQTLRQRDRLHHRNYGVPSRVWTQEEARDDLKAERSRMWRACGWFSVWCLVLVGLVIGAVFA